MGGFGWHNPFPFELGGGPTTIEQVYETMRGLVGRGGTAATDTGVDGLYRQVRAVGFGLLKTFDERAVLQAFPNHATDALAYYEWLFAIPPDPTASDSARREAAAVAYTRQILSAIPDVRDALLAIDPRLSIADVPHEASDVTEPGRAFQDLAASQPFNGGRKSTAFPNYSNEFRVHVVFDVGDGVLPGFAEERVMRIARAVLNDVLPAWNDVQIHTDFDGFDLDIDLLDYTALT